MKKGFTLVEILAVIVVLALLLTLVTPSIQNAGNSVKKKACETKYKTIVAAANDYIEDNYLSIKNNKKDKVSVGELVASGYIVADSGVDVINPINNSSMNGLTISFNIDGYTITAEGKVEDVCK